MPFFDWLMRSDSAQAPADLPLALLSVSLAFLGGHLLAWVYMITREDRTLSRSFVNALVMMPVLVALVMLVLQDSLITAFGMMSVFAIVRFRNVLDDTQDTTYVLASIVLGLAAGTQRYAIAVIGAAVVTTIFLYLHFTAFGTRRRHGFILNLHWSRPPAELTELLSILQAYGRKVECTSHRARDGGGTDVAYRLMLRDPAQFERMLGELRAVDGISRLTSLRSEEDVKT